MVGCGSSTLIRELVDDGYSAIIAVDIAQTALDRLHASLGDRANCVTMVRADARTIRLPQTVMLWHDRATFHFLTDPAEQTAYATTAAGLVRPGGCLVLAEFASGLSATFAPFTKAVAPLSQVNTSAADFTAPSIVKVFRKVARSFAFAGEPVQIHCISARAASGEAARRAKVSAGTTWVGFMRV